MTEYDAGTAVLLSGQFADASGLATDPTMVVVEVSDPTGTKTTIADVARTGTGAYTAVFVATVAGPHSYRFAGTGAVQIAASKGFSVKLTPFA